MNATPLRHDRAPEAALPPAAASDGAPSPHSALFQNPSFFLLFRRLAVPLLRTHEHPKLWIAGCSSAEELYSYCILLEEEGLARRFKLYATGLDVDILEQARNGLLERGMAADDRHNYREAGGRRQLADHFSEHEDRLELTQSLLERVVFRVHDSANDGPFDEFQAISCRGLVTRLPGDAQHRVQGTLHDSLRLFGHLGLGPGESPGSMHGRSYRSLSASEPLYQRVR